MKLFRYIVLVGILCAPEMLWAAASHNVSVNPAYDERSLHLSITTNDVVLIRTPDGTTAVVQFTSISAFSTATEFGPLTASYRWRYRSSAEQTVQTGTGTVCESYNHKPRADGTGDDVTPKADHDPVVRAGDIQIDWSYGTESNGYLYYYPSRAMVQVLGPDAFNRDL